MPTHTRRREKLFGEGRCLPLDRNSKARIMTLARALSHPTEKRKHYGIITAKFLAVLDALLWNFHNAATGRCFPSYESIAARAHCNRDTVYEAIHALEEAGILTWVHRLARIRDWGPDLFGRAQNRWRVIRTSNAYAFIDPKTATKPPDPSKSEITTGTPNQDIILSLSPAPKAKSDLSGALGEALLRLGAAVRGAT